MRWLKRFVLFLLLVFIVPALAHAGFWIAKPRPSSWNAADWSSANILPKVPTIDSAAVYIFSARTGGLKGAFATHSWIVTKQAGDQHYNRYDVVGWGSPVRKNLRDPDGKWYSNFPEIHHEVRGAAARELIPILEQKIAAYRWREYGDYTVWPGPNSNTFVSSIISQIPQLNTSTPATAVGRDFPANEQWFSFENGVLRVTLGGYAGFAAGKNVGLELNFLGLVAGLDHATGEIKIPAFGAYSIF
jgi:hypothetical protein